jgi:type VI secretion system protein ImpF
MLPCLLDRLMNDDPGAKIDTADRRVMTYQRYRDSVVRDLGCLLNTSRSLEDLEGAGPEVRRSVLNFGMADVAGRASAGMGEEVRRYLIQAIQTYEPRILPDTLIVTEVEGAEGGQLAFEIRGQLWAQPMPRDLYLRTEIDLETGQCDLRG